MRAMIVNEFGPPETLRLADAPTPVPGAGEVLVEVQAAPVNYVDCCLSAAPIRCARRCRSYRGRDPQA